MKRGPAPTRAARLIWDYGEGGRMASASWTDHDSAPAVPTPQAPGRRWGRVLGQIGYLIGGAIAKSQAAAKVAAGGGNVTVIPLDSISSLETRKSKGWLGGQHLIVTTADGAQYGFGVKLDRWSADLANALTAHGCEARTTPQGMAVTSAPNA